MSMQNYIKKVRYVTARYKNFENIVFFRINLIILQDMKKPVDYTVNVRGRLIDLSEPRVMGILNVTPDSFFSGSRKQTEREIAERANAIMEEGGTFIDVGALRLMPKRRRED